MGEPLSVGRFQTSEEGEILHLPATVAVDGCDKESSLIYEATYKRGKRTLVDGLKYFPPIIESAKSLHPDQVFKVVIDPKKGQAYLEGFLREDNGRMTKFIKLEEVGNTFSNLANISKTIGSQILLIHIALKLHEIEVKLEGLYQENRNDRYAEIHAGIDLYRIARTQKDPHNQSIFLANAIQSLEVGFHKCRLMLREDINRLPGKEINLTNNWIKDKTLEMKEKMGPVEESFYYCISAVKAIADCLIQLGQPDYAKNNVALFLKEVCDCGIHDVAEKARLMECASGEYPEEKWEEFLANYNGIERDVLEIDMCRNKDYDCIEIEMTPNELLMGDDANGKV